jgi:aminopeptidase N
MPYIRNKHPIMRLLKYFFSLILLAHLISVKAQFIPERYFNQDVAHYRFALSLNDETNEIQGSATLLVRFRAITDTVSLDLSDEMKVREIKNDKGVILKFLHRDDIVHIVLPQQGVIGGSATLMIQYQGIPEDGLIIGNNKFGDRTFFGDNWPNRAHHWLPCNDHPRDKATVEFIITAPEYYDVVSNGEKIQEFPNGLGFKTTHWREIVPLPTKVMVIGVARFAMEHHRLIQGVPSSTWVFPQNREEGFSDFKPSQKVLDWFIRNIGPFPFSKLAHVQSKTRWGGMENAGAIFYFENSVNGRNERESLIAHETAHQWFGNSATEADWRHVWLSEGFATYTTVLYLENRYGVERLKKELLEQRKTICAYYEKVKTPIVDLNVTDINTVLSTNTYQKAGWVLHMLRVKLGDALFWEGLKTYYARYKYGNTLTENFRQVMEEVSGISLQEFFNQWFYQSGHPILSYTWQWNEDKKELQLTIHQTQNDLFAFPLEIAFYDRQHRWIETLTFSIRDKHTTFFRKLKEKPSVLEPDPHTHLLFDLK